MALLDVLKNKKKMLPGSTSAAATQSLQQTAATGKAQTAGAGPQTSGIQSQLAQQGAQAQMGQIATQGLAQEQAIGAQETQQQAATDLASKQIDQRASQQRQDIAAQSAASANQRQTQDEMAVKELQAAESKFTKEISNTYANALADMAASRKIAEQDIFSEAKQMREELGAEQTQAWLEQVSHRAALSDRAYVDEISRIGRERDLENANNFNKVALETSFGNNFEIMDDFMDMQAAINADEREYKRALEQMDLDHAVKMAGIAAKEAAMKNMITGGADMAAGMAGGMFGGGKAKAAGGTGAMTGTQSVSSVTPGANSTSARTIAPANFDPSINQTPQYGHNSLNYSPK